MSGSQKNMWNSYLNGKTDQYNFSYKDDNPPSLNPIPQINNQNTKVSSMPNTSIINKKQNGDKQNGGKRKTKRYSKKYRLSRHK